MLLSADWVLPVDGPPIADGAVAIEAGRIAAVGRAAELGRGRRFERAAILREVDRAVAAEEYWLSDETYSGDPATEVSVRCVGVDGSETVVALRWDPARLVFSRP